MEQAHDIKGCSVMLAIMAQDLPAAWRCLQHSKACHAAGSELCAP